jgi:hypothetical protein
MRRIILLLSVVALMVVMLAMSVAPAFASPPFFQCTNPNTGQSAFVIGGQEKKDARDAGFTECRVLRRL